MIGFAENYSDNSGVEYAVTWDSSKPGYELTIKSGPDEVRLPRDRLEWLLNRLNKIEAEVSP
jgi:hypothetical protein